MQRSAVIIGAGPAGLTAAFELLARTDVTPMVLEMSDTMGGIARTVNYKGNRIDIGGHRFFSKSDRVMQWWLKMLPIQKLNGEGLTISYQRNSREVATTDQGPDPDQVDRVMLVRKRKSRIYFLRKFFNYPIALNGDTVRKLGMPRIVKMGLSYAKAAARPIRNPQNLEQFFINQFGKELYLTFFKSYTEKVWGESCSTISAEWGAQRVKGLSITKAVLHQIKKLLPHSNGIAQKDTETSLIERFLYPKYGPGQMWETVAHEVQRLGGRVLTHQRVAKVCMEDGQVVAVEAVDSRTGEVAVYRGDFFFSTMPITELVRSLDVDVPQNVREVSDGLVYRDFITVGLLLNGLKLHDDTPEGRRLIQDNWIYIQEPDVQVGRLQIFNNWSPYLVADPSKVWIGLEYFCYERDSLWKKSDEEMIALGKEELSRIGILDPAEVLDATVIRMPKTYPAYFGSFNRFQEVREYLDAIPNLFLIGRNGMHRYNNQDHSMLTAMVAVDNILEQRTDKSNIWDVNTEQDYHEAKEDVDERQDCKA